MTLANVISIRYEFENDGYYMYIIFERKNPFNDKFYARFQIYKEIDNVYLLRARLTGININISNKTEFEQIYRRSRKMWPKTSSDYISRNISRNSSRNNFSSNEELSISYQFRECV